MMMNTVSDFDFRVSRYLWSVIFRVFLFCFWFWDGDQLKCHSNIIFSFEICYALGFSVMMNIVISSVGFQEDVVIFDF